MRESERYACDDSYSDERERERGRYACNDSYSDHTYH
jgi:hypothetical protein